MKLCGLVSRRTDPSSRCRQSETNSPLLVRLEWPRRDRQTREQWSPVSSHPNPSNLDLVVFLYGCRLASQQQRRNSPAARLDDNNNNENKPRVYIIILFPSTPFHHHHHHHR